MVYVPGLYDVPFCVCYTKTFNSSKTLATAELRCKCLVIVTCKIEFLFVYIKN